MLQLRSKSSNECLKTMHCKWTHKTRVYYINFWIQFTDMADYVFYYLIFTQLYTKKYMLFIYTRVIMVVNFWHNTKQKEFLSECDLNLFFAFSEQYTMKITSNYNNITFYFLMISSIFAFELLSKEFKIMMVLFQKVHKCIPHIYIVNI